MELVAKWFAIQTALKQTVAPTEEPLTLVEAKAHLHVDHDEEDDHIETLIKAAREHAEVFTRLQFLTATYTVKFDRFPDDEIRPPKPPLASVTSITYVDVDGNTQTLATTVYSIDTDSKPGRIKLAYNQSWPSVRSQMNAITVTFTNGYAATATGAALPGTVKQGMALLVGDMYEHREARTEGRVQDNPTVERLLTSIRNLEAA